LSLFNISNINYIGLDISPTVIEKCKIKFENDIFKKFYCVDGFNEDDFSKIQHGDFGLSLDVLYYLIEDSVYYSYIQDLLNLSKKYVIIYSSNEDLPYEIGTRVKHRKFTPFIESTYSNWKLINNEYPSESSADLYIYEKLNQVTSQL
jgi:hypothetical protein